MTFPSSPTNGQYFTTADGTVYEFSNSGWVTKIPEFNVGSPESSIVGNVGDLVSDTTNGKLYIKKTGSTNTGWVELSSIDSTITTIPDATPIPDFSNNTSYEGPSDGTSITAFTNTIDGEIYRIWPHPTTGLNLIHSVGNIILPGESNIELSPGALPVNLTFRSGVAYLTQDAAVAPYIAKQLNGGRALTDHLPNGVLSTNATTNTSALQECIDAVEADGGGRVILPAISRSDSATLCFEPFELANKVRVVGAGLGLTHIKAADGINADFIKTKDFATLTGTDTWLVSGGVPVLFGLEGVTINGNRLNQTAGRAVTIYGKNFFLDVDIFDAYEESLYSECASSGGQTDYEDLPEGYGYVRSWRDNARTGNPTDAMTIRGPHDTRWELVVGNAYGNGVVFETSSGVYGAKSDLRFAHIYGCEQHGIVLDASITAPHLISESNDRAGLLMMSGGNQSQITGEFYRNNIRRAGTGSEYQVELEAGADDNILNIETFDRSIGGGGILVNGANNVINGVLNGEGTGTKSAIRNVGWHNTYNCTTHDWNSGDVSAEAALSMGGNFVYYNVQMDNNDIHVEQRSLNRGCTYAMNVRHRTGQTIFSGTVANGIVDSNTFRVTVDNADLVRVVSDDTDELVVKRPQVFNDGWTLAGANHVGLFEITDATNIPADAEVPTNAQNSVGWIAGSLGGMMVDRDNQIPYAWANFGGSLTFMELVTKEQATFFTPTIVFGNDGDFATTQTVNSAVGRYVRHGDSVTFYLSIDVDTGNYTGASGQLRVSSFPFTPNAQINRYYGEMFTYTGVTPDAGSATIMVRPFIDTTNTHVAFEEVKADGTTAVWDVNNILPNTNVTIQFKIEYRV